MRLFISFLSLLSLLFSPFAYASFGAVEPSSAMAMKLVCDVYTAGSGNLMLMIGFLVAVYGLFTMIVKAAYKMGMVMVIFGALMTALPGIVVSFLEGGSHLMYQAGLSDSDNSTMIHAAISQAGNCDAIQVDFSSYDGLSNDFWAAPTGTPGTPGYTPGGAGSRGSPGIKQAQSVKGEIIRASMDMSNMSCSEGVNSSINNLVGGNTGKITSCFKTGRKCSGCSENHGALDVIATNIGRPPITTPQAGTVSFASFVGGYGNRVHVNHGGVKSSYSHMSGIAVSMGQSVAAGDQVGTMGNTGGNYAVHLHYENHEGGMKVNPCGKLGISC